MDIKQFEKLPVMGILRGIDFDSIEPITDVIISSGLKTVEITMNSSRASELISSMRKIAGDSLTIGAGTVLSVEDTRKAIDSGASFIVSPVCMEDVVGHCVANHIPVFPGAMTPSEVYRAWEAGASMIKIFPAKFFGPSYFKELRAPLQDVRLLACGGVTSQNAKEYFENGASAVAFGGSIFKKEWIKQNKFLDIERSIKELILAIK